MRFFRILRVLWHQATADTRRRKRKEERIPSRPDPATADYLVAESFDFGTWDKKAQDYARQTRQKAQELAWTFREGQKDLKRIHLRQEKETRCQARREFWRSVRLFCKKAIGLA